MSPPDPCPEKVWVPKNKEISFQVKDEKEMTPEFWKKSNFPHRPIPTEVYTKVKVDVWDSQIDLLARRNIADRRLDILREVRQQLKEGMDSGVVHPGTKATYSKNFFPEPAIDIPRIADSLCTEIKEGHMAGPLEPYSIPNAKVNGFISVKKLDGSRRQCGNLSSPEGSAFNDGIPDSTMKIWPVDQTTSKQFAEKLARAGFKALMCCCDLKSAYKCLPVCKKQRRLQVFSFGGKWFVDLRAVFGDKSACMYFDRFHRCIMDDFVLINAPLPRRWLGQTVDDISGAAPLNAGGQLERFVREYRKQLDRLGISAAHSLVLGIWFNSEDLTWKLPQRKLISFVRELLEATLEDACLSLNQAEIIHGKLVFFAQHSLPLKVLVSEVIEFMKALMEEHKDLNRASMSKSKKIFRVPSAMKHDLKTTECIIWHTTTEPLPILEPGVVPSLDAQVVYTDASGHLLANPSVGIYVPSQGLESALVASLALPRSFLAKIDQDGHKAYCKSTTLEGLGYLAALCWDPDRVKNKDIVFLIDNQAAVIALRKGYSKGDPWATTIVRAARVVAAAIGSSLFAKWVPRRSSRETRVADDLTHNILSELTSQELQAYVDSGMVSFPPPICSWMASPRPDQGLGRKCLDWMREKFGDIMQ